MNDGTIHKNESEPIAIKDTVMLDCAWKAMGKTHRTRSQKVNHTSGMITMQ